MITKECDSEKVCCLYANDFHLEMILLPYIKENLYKTNFIIMTQNDLEDTVKILLERINLNEFDKKEIYNINWNNKSEEKFEYIKKCINMDRETFVIVNGNVDYIERITKEIERLENEKINIITCYNIEDLNKNHIDLSNCQVLNTRKI